MCLSQVTSLDLRKRRPGDEMLTSAKEDKPGSGEWIAYVHDPDGKVLMSCGFFRHQSVALRCARDYTVMRFEEWAEIDYESEGLH